MELVLSVYWVCLIVGGLFLLILGFGGHLSAGHDVGTGHGIAVGHVGHGLGMDHDAGAGAPAHDTAQGGDGVPWFSPFVLASFLTMFGGSGIACHSGGVPPIVSAPLSTVVGLAAASLAFFALNALYKHAQSSTGFSVDELEGLEGTVETPIPADGVGEVAVTIAGRRHTGPARSSDGSAIPKHATVRIDRVMGSTLLVREAVEERLRNLRSDGASTE